MDIFEQGKNLINKIKQDRIDKDNKIREEFEKREDAEAQRRAEFETILSNIREGSCVSFDGRKAHIIDNIERKDYLINISSKHKMLCQINHPVDLYKGEIQPNPFN